MQVDVLTTDDTAALRDFVAKTRHCSVQSSLDWANLICDLKEDKPYFIVAKKNDEIVGALSLYFFKNKRGNLLTSNAWNTISGILCSQKITEQEQVYSALVDYSISLAHELDCAVLSISTNPFLNDKDLYLNILKPDYVLENFVQYLLLDEVFDQKGNFVHPNYIRRTNLSRNLKKSRQSEITISEEQCQEYVNQAFFLQEKRLMEVGAHPFPREFFESALQNITLKGRGKFLFAFHEDRMIGMSLFLSSDKIMDIYMLCMDINFADLRPNFALTEYMLNRAHKNSIPTLNWMSSPRKDGGVYQWKKQWGSREGIFLHLTKVTGDISSWKELSYEELGNAYKFHYLLPFNLLRVPQSQTTTKNELALFMHHSQLK